MEIRLTLLLIAFSLLFNFGDVQLYMSCAYFRSPTDLVASPSVLKSIQIPQNSGRNYLPNQHCEWRLKAEDSNDVIAVTIKRCNVQGPDYRDVCVMDYLDIYDVKSGERIHMDRLCGSRAEGRVFLSSSSEMMIHFISDMSFEFSGFRLTYMAKPKPSRESDDGDLKIALGVSIPTGLAAISLLVCVSILLYRKWQSKMISRTRQSSNQPTTVSHYDSVNTTANRLGNSPNLPLRVSLPDYDDSTVESSHRISRNNSQTRDYSQMDYVYGDNGTNVRSVTPPPSYDYAVRQASIENGMPLYPPDYNSIVKDDFSLGQTDIESGV